MYSEDQILLNSLIESGFISEGHVDQARQESTSGESVVDVLIRKKILSEEDVARSQAFSAGMEFVDLRQVKPAEAAIAAMTPDVAKRYKVVPVALDGGFLTIATSDPSNLETADALPHRLPDYMVDFVCATPSQIREALVAYYGDEADIGKLVKGQEEGLVIDEGAEGEVTEDDAPIIRLVQNTLLEAFRSRASDIHIEPLEGEVRVRYRIDGVLHKTESHPKRLLPAIISRLKIMTGTMSIAEKRVPQDGRIQAHLGKKELDLRVSAIPTNHGESIVMRILDKQNLEIGLPELGFFSDDEETFRKLITLPDGILLVTGPTGSGKTTTLYACLSVINKPDRKIITVEDPVEYQLNGINQVQVKEDIGMTFASALRSILRQAPNIIMIGEIRDEETANIAINASLTGHLVFSTLHTNDAPSAVARLTDIGIKPFLIASAIRAIMAQRLVRKLCGECKVDAILNEKQLRALRLSESQMLNATAKDPGGCEVCRGTGFKGRMGIFELFVIDDEVRHMINERLSTPQLRKRARELGMRSLREDGIRKVLRGVTAADEVIRATMSDFD